MVAKLTNILLDKRNLKCLSNNVCSFGQGFRSTTFTIDYLRMDRKRAHVMCGNNRHQSNARNHFEICKLGGETPALFRPVGTLQDFAWLDLRKNEANSIT